jgi:hypothetical protein
MILKCFFSPYIGLIFFVQQVYQLSWWIEGRTDNDWYFLLKGEGHRQNSNHFHYDFVIVQLLQLAYLSFSLYQDSFKGEKFRQKI